MKELNNEHRLTIFDLRITSKIKNRCSLFDILSSFIVPEALEDAGFIRKNFLSFPHVSSGNLLHDDTRFPIQAFWNDRLEFYHWLFPEASGQMKGLYESVLNTPQISPL